jgi:Xylose isomerase-like TIM barrel
MPSRREFLQSAAATLAASHELFADAKPKQPSSLAREVGITTSSLSGHLVPRPRRGKFTLLELPKILRDELDMRVIDLNTSTPASFEPRYLDKVRQAVADAKCVLTNLKLNQRGLDMSSREKAVREKALKEYERSIDAAARLGIKWARPLPLKNKPDMKLHVAAYQRLADYAARRGVQMLVENYGWMEDDPNSVAKLIKAVGGKVAAQDGAAATHPDRIAASPDTGNWKDNTIRYAGLAKTFPLAVTCDFKARQIGPKGEHKLYDLKRCFDIGWKAGFRGPWCLEHANRDRKSLFRELALLRDMLRGWMKDVPK